MDQNLIIRVKTIKFFEENTGINLHDLGLNNDYLDTTSKTQTTEEKIN